MFKYLICFATIFAVVLGAIACSSPATSTAPTDTAVAAIRAYADPATRTTLEGLSEDNLVKYTQYADAQFKAALTQAIFDQTYAQINSQLGSFESIAFLSTEQQGSYTIVHYRATYTKGTVGIRMVFDTEHLVAGQWFE